MVAIQKVENPNIRRTGYNAQFPPMPQLYLELLENPDKVKPELLGKPFTLPAAPPMQVNTTSGDDIQFEFSKPPNDADSGVGSGAASEAEASEVDELDQRLQELLDDSDPAFRKISRASTPHRSSSHRRPATADIPPPLSKLGVKQENVAANINGYEDGMEDKKRELLFKFEVLKKSYKTDKVPEFSMHSDYYVMKKQYDTTVRSLALDSSVETYKSYLIGAFLAVEFVCGKYLKFDMEGFSQMQISKMDTYDKLLIEIGEKNYIPQDSDWPVEARLLGLVVLNTAIFIGARYFAKHTGKDILSTIHGMNTATERHMKGPDEFELE